MAFKMRGNPMQRNFGIGSPTKKHTPDHNGDTDPKEEESKSGTLEKLGSKLDPYLEKVKKTVGKGVEAHRKGVEKTKDILTGDIARTGAALGMGPLGVAGQVTKEIYEKVTGKGKEGSSVATSAKEATKTVEDKPKPTKLKKTPVGVVRPKQELEKMEGKKPTTISTPQTEKNIVKKQALTPTVTETKKREKRKK